MATTEQQRLELHLELRKRLGDDVANTLMEHLPPSGWGDVARVHDLQALEQRLDLRIDILEQRMQGFDTRLTSFENRMTGSFRTLIASVLTVSVALLVMMVQLSISISRLN